MSKAKGRIFTVKMNVKITLKLKRSDFVDLADVAKTLLEERTNKGTGTDETPLKAYSKKPIYISKQKFYPKPLGGEPKKKTVYYPGGYAQYKVDTLGITNVDLHRTSRMFRSMYHKISVRKFKFMLLFRSKSAKYKAYQNDLDRPFFGFRRGTKSYVHLKTEAIRMVTRRFKKEKR